MCSQNRKKNHRKQHSYASTTASRPVEEITDLMAAIRTAKDAAACEAAMAGRRAGELLRAFRACFVWRENEPNRLRCCCPAYIQREYSASSTSGHHATNSVEER